MKNKDMRKFARSILDYQDDKKAYDKANHALGKYLNENGPVVVEYDDVAYLLEYEMVSVPFHTESIYGVKIKEVGVVEL